MVANNSGAPMVTSQVTITFDNADLFSSATVTATAGDATSTATVVPVTGGDSPEQSNLTVFNLEPPLVVPAGESATISLSVVVSNTPHVTMWHRPVMYASMIPGDSLRGWGSGLLASMLLLSVGTILVTSSRPRRMYFVLVIVLLAMTSQVGCDNGSIGSPSSGSSGSSSRSSVPVSNQNARGVTANNQNTGDKITVSGFPPAGIPLSTISVP
jgi:hypothetical protein